MQACAVMCKLRPEIVNLDLEDQLALVRGCHEADAIAYAKCGAEKLTLIDALKDCAQR
jgi:hypothetical protein